LNNIIRGEDEKNMNKSRLSEGLKKVLRVQYCGSIDIFLHSFDFSANPGFEAANQKSATNYFSG
jgi:hypothetical protein